MKLLDLVEQFFYSHAPNFAHKKLLLKLIKDAEEGYLRRIAELENDALVEANARAIRYEEYLSE